MEKFQNSPHLSCGEIWNFSTWPIFSPRIYPWDPWQISGMLLKGISDCAGVVALRAAERFSSWMGEHVFLQVASGRGGVVALCATERLFSTMNHHVCFQCSSFDGWEIALAATVGILSMMLKRMVLEVFSHFEREITLCTRGLSLLCFFHGLLLRC